MSIEAFPLEWPIGRPRSPGRPRRSLFSVTFARARDDLLSDLRLLGARQVVISTNLPLRRDGLPYANQAEPRDSAAAVYFVHRGRQMCFACDRWRHVRDNLWAIKKTIEAIRGIERWGTGDMVEAAYAGFQALPPPPSWRSVLGLKGDQVDRQAIEQAYKRLSLVHHPDRGGDAEKMAELAAAVSDARKEFPE